MVHFEAAEPPQILRTCFFWSGWDGRLQEGPYCLSAEDVTPVTAGTVNVWLQTRNPGRYRLDGYTEYQREGKTEKTKEVSAMIDVG